MFSELKKKKYYIRNKGECKQQVPHFEMSRRPQFPRGTPPITVHNELGPFTPFTATILTPPINSSSFHRHEFLFLSAHPSLSLSSFSLQIKHSYPTHTTQHKTTPDSLSLSLLVQLGNSFDCLSLTPYDFCGSIIPHAESVSFFF